MCWGPFGVCAGSILRSDGDSGFRPPRDQISRPLGPMLAPLLDPMLAPCWQLLGVLGYLGAFLERSRTYLEAMLIDIEHKTEAGISENL